jgi:hypothetical protein
LQFMYRKNLPNLTVIRAQVCFFSNSILVVW